MRRRARAAGADRHGMRCRDPRRPRRDRVSGTTLSLAHDTHVQPPPLRPHTYLSATRGAHWLTTQHTQTRTNACMQRRNGPRACARTRLSIHLLLGAPQQHPLLRRPLAALSLSLSLASHMPNKNNRRSRRYTRRAMPVALECNERSLMSSTVASSCVQHLQQGVVSSRTRLLRRASDCSATCLSFSCRQPPGAPSIQQQRQRRPEPAWCPCRPSSSWPPHAPSSSP